MKFEPFGNRVLVLKPKAIEKTEGGIIIPDTGQEVPRVAIVEAVGDGRIKENGELEPMNVKVGDKVVFGKFAGTEVKYDGKIHLVLREDDLMGKLVE